MIKMQVYDSQQIAESDPGELYLPGLSRENYVKLADVKVVIKDLLEDIWFLSRASELTPKDVEVYGQKVKDYMKELDIK